LRLFAFLFLWFVFITSLLKAQSIDLRFNHFTSEQGLSNNEVTSIAQDKDGFIWIGTLDGLNRFDGYNIKVYKHISDDSTSILNNYISNILVDSRNCIWIGTLDGISLYNKDQDNFQSLKVYYKKNEQTNNYITSFVEDLKGNVLVSNDKGSIYQFDRKSTRFNSLLNDAVPSINCMILCNDIVLYAGTKGGLYTYNRKTKKVKKVLLIDNIADKQLNITALVYSNNILWIGTAGTGVLRYNPLLKKTTYLNKILHLTSDGDARINQLYLDKYKNLWIGDAVGIKMYNPESGVFKIYDHNPNSNYSLNTDGGKAIFIDNQQNKWFGTSLGGVSVAFDRKKFSNLKPEKEGAINLSKSIVSSVLKDKEGNLWIGYYNEGIDVINMEKRTKMSFNPEDGKRNSLGHSTVQIIYLDHKNDIWVGTYIGGLEYFEKGSHGFRSYLHDPSNPNSIAGNDVRSIVEDKQGNLWLVIHGVGIDKFDIKNKRFYHFVYGPTDPKAVISNWNFKLMIDSYDTIWLAGSTGLCKLNYDGSINQVFVSNPQDNTSLSSKYLNDVYEDHRKNLWIGTFEGLNYFNRKTRKFVRITIKSGLTNDNVKSILEDHKGNIWVSTNKGISKIRPAFDNMDNLISYDIRNYDERDGIESNAFFERSCYLDPKTDEMYFGGLKGLTFFSPEGIKDNSQVASVVFTDFKLFYHSVSFHDKNSPLKKQISQTKLIRLKYSQNVLTFEYTAINFIIPGKNQFAYIMEGFDKKWNYVGSEHKATYTNLDPGTYTFRVKASNNDGLWSTSDASIRIIIDPPFWKSIWALWIAFIVIGISTYLLYRLVAYREKLKNQLQLAKVEAKKVQEIGQLKLNFFTQISHEFRTPLTLIISPLEKLMKQNNENNSLVNDYKLIYKNVHRLKRLINQLLDFRKSEEGFLKLEQSHDDIVLFINGIASSFDDLSKQRNIKYTYASDVTSLYTWFDPDKLEKILYNLISNAFKYTPDDGQVNVSVKLMKNGDINPTKKSECLEIMVKDNGIGMSAESLQKIFSLFYQVEGNSPFKGDGTGIGLALTKKLVEIHHGKILVESALGVGSCFTILIPVEDLSLEKNQIGNQRLNMEERITSITSEFNSVNNPEMDEFTGAHDENIPLLLIVEDNTDLLYHLNKELLPFYRVMLASHGSEGYDKAREAIPDLVISDVMMPGMDGIELCRKLKTNECTSHIPIILLTARPLDEHKIEGYETGADDYITKPFSIPVLLSRIRNLIESRRKLRELFGNGYNFTPKQVAVNSTDELFLNKALSIIQVNISDCNFGPPEFAREIGLSRSQLYRKIQALTDKSVSEFMSTVKLNKAAEMLLENKYTISEVAFAVGYTEQSNFTRSFNKQFGQSPTNFIASQKDKATSKS
jgi:signal transduction histidine kinase/ligand-binding sensor domain-containing protein/DNA-binding response OmpR family regulator